MKCCFCIERRIGCYIIAGYFLLSFLHETTTCSIDLKNGRRKFCYLGAAKPKERTLTPALKAMHILVLFISIPMLVFTIIFIVGLITESRLMILMFIIAFIVYLVLTIIIVIVVTSLAVSHTANRVFWYTYTILGVLLGAYLIAVVVDEYMNMSD